MNIALITGAASGIGLALTRLYLEKQCLVIMVDKNEKLLKKSAEQLNELFSQQILYKICDVTEPNAVAQLAHEVSNEVPHINWIYNNAGIIGSIAPIWELTPAQVHQVMSVNVYGMLHVLHAFMPLLLQQNETAHIINMASLYALCAGSQLAPYSMSKHAVLSLSESLYFDLKRLEKNINVSVVFPSFTDTSLLSASPDDSTFHSTLNSLLAHSRPAQEVAQQIIHEVEQKKFYIFPDREVKGYYEERTHAVLNQDNPHINNVEKLIISLAKRSK